MTTFAVISEGPTDYEVIKAIVLGLHSDQRPLEPEVIRTFPPIEGPGGWTVLRDELVERKTHLQALQFNDYVVVHVDTDCCEESGFDVPRNIDGHERTPTELADAVRKKLIEWMGGSAITQYLDQFVFAVAVNQTECWLLPLLEAQSSRKRKVTGCLAAANSVLRRSNASPLSTGAGRSLKKDVNQYREVSKGFAKRKLVVAAAPENPSLNLFVMALDELKVDLS